MPRGNPTHRIALLAALTLAAAASGAAARADDAGLAGFWVLAGAGTGGNLSSGRASYDYTNLFSGSLTPPGFTASSEYDLKASGGAAVGPSVRIAYVASRGALYYGFSAGLERVGAIELDTGAFDLPSTYAVSDQPRGFRMRTRREAGTELLLAFEPGVRAFGEAMGYLRLSYRQLHARTSTLTSTQSGLSNPASVEATDTRDWTGLGAGAGIRLPLGGGFGLDALAEYVSYLSRRIPASTLTSTGDEVTVTQTQVVSWKRLGFSVSLGYRF